MGHAKNNHPGFKKVNPDEVSQEDMLNSSELELVMLVDLRSLGLEPVREYKFHPIRNWRFDFAFPDARIAIEIEGGTHANWYRSRHVSASGYAEDCDKYNEASLAGWTLLRFTSHQVGTRKSIRQVTRALAQRGVRFLPPDWSRIRRPRSKDKTTKNSTNQKSNHTTKRR